MNKAVLSIFCSLLLGVASCSSKVPASGTVTFPDGTPLESGTVFMSNGLVMYQGGIRPDGTFVIGEMRDGDGIEPGEYKIWIANANMVENVYNDKNEVVGRVDKLAIDPKFERRETSNLTFVAKEKEKNRIEIVVERPPDRR